MAYLKGGTVVDGNLYIEGGLRVKQIVDASGKKMPHLHDEGSSMGDRIVKFTDSNAAIKYSLLEEIFVDTAGPGVETISIKDTPVESIDRVLFKINSTDLVAVQNSIMYLGGDSGTGFSHLRVNTDDIVLNMTPDKVSVNTSKVLKGLVKNPNGTITLNGGSQKYSISQNYVSNPPEIFCYI